MEEATVEDLGLSEDMSWENEQQERKGVFNKIQQMKNEAFMKAMNKRREEMGMNKET